MGEKPNVLFRRADLVLEGVDNEGKILLSPEVFKLKAMQRGMTRIEGDVDLVKEIRCSEAWDEELKQAIEHLKNGAPRALRKGLEELNMEDGLILFWGKVYVPKDMELRCRVVQLHHNTLPAGHPG